MVLNGCFCGVYGIVNSKHTHTCMHHLTKDTKRTTHAHTKKRQSYNAIWSYQLQFNVKLCDKWIQRNGREKISLKRRWEREKIGK